MKPFSSCKACWGPAWLAPFFYLRLVLIAFSTVLALTAVALADDTDVDAQSLATQLQQLTGRDFDSKSQAIEAIAVNPHPMSAEILTQLLDGNLYRVKATDAIAVVSKAGKNYQAVDVLSGEDLGSFKKRKLKKLSINNSLRSLIKSKLATLELRHEDEAKRLSAVKNLMKDMDEQTVTTLQSLLEQETSEAVRKAMFLAMAMQALDAADPQRRVMAVVLLEESLDPLARNRLVEARHATTDEEFASRLDLALKRIDSRLSFYHFIENLFFGLSLGSVLVLAAIGLAITFGVMGVINMAHGELIMLGAYTTYVMQQLMPEWPGLALLLSIPMGFLVAGSVGILIERGVIRFLYGRPLETLLATFGISLLLQQAVRSIFSPLNRSVTTPEWLSGSIEINEVLSLTLNRVGILGFSLFVFIALTMVLRYTSLGLQVRAVSQNRAMARAMGIRSARVDALTFGLGSGIAGIAGVALSQLTNVGPNLGQAYIIDSFMVVVFGGVGNLWGTLISGMSLGVLNKFLEPWSGAVLAKILVLVLLILFIQKKPRGLFPPRGRMVEA